MSRDYTRVVMVTFNRLDFTKQSIKALADLKDKNFRLTVVDNHSTDETPAYLAKLQKKGAIDNLLVLPENVGVARASNIGWRLDPDAAYYLKLDNDIVIQKKSWLTDMIRVAEKVPEIGTIGYNFEDVSYPSSEIGGEVVRVKRGSLGGACVLISRKTHARFGYWNEEYGLYGEEDADYGLRVQAAGLLNVYMKDENIGLHLPAGKAAIIDRSTHVAKDGQEEIIHKEYREWKDRQRRRNQGKLKRNLIAYLVGVKGLYCRSTMNIPAWQNLRRTAEFLPDVLDLPPDVNRQPVRRKIAPSVRILFP